GLLCTDVVHDYARSELRRLDATTPAHIDTRYAELEARARIDLEREGLAPSTAAFRRTMDLRYAGQGYELEVPAPNGPLDGAALAALRGQFDARHEALHGHRAEGEPVEIVNYRLRVVVAVPKFEPRPLAAGSRRLPDGQRQPASFAPDGAPWETAVY